LNCYKKQRSVAVANPSSYIGCSSESFGLALSEKLDWTVFTAFGGNCKDALTLQGQRRLADRNEPKEGMHGGETGIACPH
jgi:hypothetical protein